jgi:hypothetical protein
MRDEGDDVPDRRSNRVKMGRETIELAIGCARDACDKRSK